MRTPPPPHPHNKTTCSVASKNCVCSGFYSNPAFNLPSTECVIFTGNLLSSYNSLSSTLCSLYSTWFLTEATIRVQLSPRHVLSAERDFCSTELSFVIKISDCTENQSPAYHRLSAEYDVLYRQLFLVLNPLTP
jgi:hypothetical protein